MKQISLRLSDAVHLRLAARARRDGRSMNAVAVEILDFAVDNDRGDRQSALPASAAAAGVLRPVMRVPVDQQTRQRIIDSTKGTRPVLDRLLAEDRDRL